MPMSFGDPRRYRIRSGHGAAGTPAEARLIEQHDEARARIAVLEAVLRENATCLGEVANMIGLPRKDGSARLGAIISREFVQRILIAGNNAATTLAAVPMTGEGE